jgi:hypothetical protein
MPNQWPDNADPRLCESFPRFLTKVWKDLGFGKPTPIQLQVAKDLQAGLDEENGGRLQVLGFRGVAKSYITVAFCVWLLYRWPNIQVLSVSATKQFAGDNAAFAWLLIQTFNWLAHMRPDRDQARGKNDFDVRGATPAKGTSFAARSIEGQITGLRADIIVADDVETPNTASTPGARSDLEKRTGEFAAILKVTSPVKVILYLGTAQTEETLYKVNETRGYKTIIYPIFFPTEEEILRYGEHRLPPGMVAAVRANPVLAGTSTDPTRFTMAEIAKRRIEFGEIEFLRQFKMFMDVGTGQTSPLMMRNLIVMDLKPWNPSVPGTGVPSEVIPSEITDKPIDALAQDILLDTLGHDNAIYGPKSVGLFGKPQGVIMRVDPSGDGLDETTWGIGAERGSMLFLLHLNASLLGYDEAVLKMIAEDAKKWGVNEIIVESNLGQGMFAALLRPALKEAKHPCTVTEERAGSDFKEKRIIESLQPVVSARQLVVNADVLRWDFTAANKYAGLEEGKRRFYRFTYQFTRMKEIRRALVHDDRVEVVADLCRTFLLRLEKTQKESRDQESKSRMSAEIKKINEARRKIGLPPLKPPSNSDIKDALNAGHQDRLRKKNSLWDRMKNKQSRGPNKDT